MILKLFILYIYKCSFAFCILHAACCGMPAVTTCLHTLEMCIIVDAIVPKKVTFARVDRRALLWSLFLRS